MAAGWMQRSYACNRQSLPQNKIPRRYGCMNDSISVKTSWGRAGQGPEPSPAYAARAAGHPVGRVSQNNMTQVTIRRITWQIKMD